MKHASEYRVTPRIKISRAIETNIYGQNNLGNIITMQSPLYYIFGRRGYFLTNS